VHLAYRVWLSVRHLLEAASEPSPTVSRNCRRSGRPGPCGVPGHGPSTVPTDLCDAEYAHLEPHLPPPSPLGRPRVRPVREILDAIFSVVRSGCAWRLLPHEFPPRKTAYHYFRGWRLDGTWDHRNAALRERVDVLVIIRRSCSAGPTMAGHDRSPTARRSGDQSDR
jgi:transposase